jgi:hypothetical protein
MNRKMENRRFNKGQNMKLADSTIAGGIAAMIGSTDFSLFMSMETLHNSHRSNCEK